MLPSSIYYTMEELKLAQFHNNYCTSKKKTSDILKTVNVRYSVADTFPGKKDLRKWSGYTSLHFAVKRMALDLTNELLEKGADLLKQGTKDGCTPLHVALSGSFDRSQYVDEMTIEEYKNYRNEELLGSNLMYTLLSKQVDINNILNPINEYGVSHLHIACILNHIQAVEFFALAKEPLDQHMNSDFSDNERCNNYMQDAQLEGFTPLHCAIKYSSVEAADILLQHGANVNVKNARGENCLHLLVGKMMYMADSIRIGRGALCMPCTEKLESIESIIKLVLNTRTSDDHIFVDDMGLSAFHLACTLEDKSITEDILKRNVDVNMAVDDESQFWPGWTPLHFAARFHIDTMILLIEMGAVITLKNSKGETALDFCAKGFSPAEVQLVLSKKDEFKEIVLSDNHTKLSDLLLAMNNYNSFSNFMQRLNDVNLIVPFSSPIWAGYNLLHLAVSLNKKVIYCKDKIRLELPENAETKAKQCSCTEMEETWYCKRIGLCLEYGCSLSMKNAKGQTPIHLAFKMLEEEAVRELLRFSKVNAVDKNDLSHLHIACAMGDLDAVKRYLSEGADVNSRVRNNFEMMITVRGNSTPLHVAVAFGHKKLVEYLIENNADVYAKDSLDLTPVHLSMSCSDDYWLDRNITRFFFETIPNVRDSVSKAGLSHLHAALTVDDCEAVKRILLEGAQVDCAVDANVGEPCFVANLAGKTPLHVAVRKSENAIEALLKAGANVHAKDLKGVSVLQYSIHHLDNMWTTPLVRMLKNGECDVEPSGITLLHFACGTYDVQWAEELLKNGADVNARISAEGELKGATPLHVIFIPSTIYEVDDNTIVNLVKLLLENGADVTIDCHGCTPIHMAYQEMIYQYNDFYLDEDYEVQLFIAQITNLMLESQKSYTVNSMTTHKRVSHFHVACIRNNVETVKRFLNHGVDVNHTVDPSADDVGGFTPLHFAMSHGSTKVAYLLLESGADLNAEDAYGNKPLQVAIKRKFVNLPLIETLLSRGADIHDENLSGETLFDCLLKYGGLTLEALEFFFGHGCFMSILDVHQGIIGSAMLSAAPNNFLPILERLTQVPEVKRAIQNGFNVIQSIVAIKRDWQLLTLDNYYSSIKFLMSIGCEIDQQDEKGETALHKAASCFNLQAVDALLQLGADLNVATNASECPFSEKIIVAANSTNETWKMDLVATLAYHVRKMKFIGLDVKNSNLKSLEKVEIVPLERSCQDELEKAKVTEIIKNLTVKDFLSEFEAVNRYPRLCPELRVIVDELFTRTLHLRRDFPQFCGLLAMQYRKACARKQLLQPASEAIVSICQISFPHLCLEAILGFFTNSDMKILIESVKELFN